MIVIKDLSKKFKLDKKHKQELGVDRSIKSIFAVKNVSFECRPGRIFTLLPGRRVCSPKFLRQGTHSRSQQSC